MSSCNSLSALHQPEWQRRSTIMGQKKQSQHSLDSAGNHTAQRTMPPTVLLS